ncbi:hypothetical protein BJY00DRAFT_282771 [Aspergillus carlsbadensis]|nr:hypothetical protein BJY00DRAFT_282771 [Aspergillus carlsbadensis]
MRSYATIPLVLAASVMAASVSTTSALPPNPTSCGGIVNKNFTVVDATQAYDCLRSVPFLPAVASRLIQYINDTIQFHSTVTYLASPPSGYQQPAVDLASGLGQIQRDIDDGVFGNEYEFEIALYTLLQAAHDDHLSLQGGILSAFFYGSPIDIVALSLDGISLPKVYIASDLPIDDWDNLSWQPSAIATINGQDVVEYLTQHAAQNSFGKLEPHADWNMLMRSGALDSQQLVEGFFGGITVYPGDTIRVTLENGTDLDPVKWNAAYLGPPYTGPLETGGDFYNFFVLGLYPVSYVPPAEDEDALETPTPTATPTPDSTPSTSSEDWWDRAYPSPEVMLPGHPKESGLPRVFFLNDSSVAVLSITRFEAYGDSTQLFVDTIKAFLIRSKKANMKKVVIDLQQNMGGQSLLAIEIFKLFFPSRNPFAGSRRRAHLMADALGNAITPYWEGLTQDQGDYNYLLTNEWVITNRLNAATGEEYTTWDDYFLSTATYNGDYFTNVEQYNLTDTDFANEAGGVQIDTGSGASSTPYAAEDIIILSDGLCSSACAVFMELMHHDAQVRTVAVGGRPDYTPMQAPSGTRGAASYTTWQMDLDIAGALALDNSTAASLPVNRGTLDFYISYASVNLRDQIRQGDPLDTPLQFQYEPADCRIFYTPRTWYRFANLWNYAAEAAWQNPRLCVANSTTTINPTRSLYPPSSSPGEPQPTETSIIESSVHLSDEEEDVKLDEAVIDHDDPTNDILAYSGPRARVDGRPCKSVLECGPQFNCVSVPVRENGRDTERNLCLASCNQLYPGTCSKGYTCLPTNGVTTSPQHVTSRRIRYLPSVCTPTTPLSFDDKPSTEGALFSTLAVDSSSSCMDNLSGIYYLHCFLLDASSRRCLVFHDGSPRLSPYPVFCQDNELQKWIHRKDVHSDFYDLIGSVAYWEVPYSPSPRLVVYHHDTMHQFQDKFDPNNPLGRLAN